MHPRPLIPLRITIKAPLKVFACAAAVKEVPSAPYRRPLDPFPPFLALSQCTALLLRVRAHVRGACKAVRPYRTSCWPLFALSQVSLRLADPLVAAPLRAEDGAIAAVQVAEAEATHHRRRK